jgi:superfamily II DNA or RNA helicase
MDFKVLQARVRKQDQAKEAARKSGYNCALLATVGFGKGKVMIDLAEELIEKYNIKRVLYTCDNTRLRDSEVEGFPAEVEKWGSSKLKKIITYECYQTTYKWSDQQYDLWLGDEIDFALTPAYSNIAFRNKFKYKILVSGTLSPSKRKLLNEIVPTVFKLDTVEAEKLGIVNKTEYYLYNYPMTEEESNDYLRYTRLIGAKLAVDDESGARLFIGKRRELLFTLTSSYKHCRKLMYWLWLKNKKTRLIVFAQRTEQADRLCKWSFHGKNEKLDHLGKFQRGEISACAVVSKVKRGINLKNADSGIYESCDGSTTEFEQRGGRFKRLEIDRMARLIFMIPFYKTPEGNYKETIVGQWVRKCTANLGNIDFIDLKI